MPYQCQHCGAAVTLSEPIPRESSCESCRHDYRACRQCRHYDPTRNNSCRETEAELVEDKQRRNFCEFFSFNTPPFNPAAQDKSREAQARAKLWVRRMSPLATRQETRSPRLEAPRSAHGLHE